MLVEIVMVMVTIEYFVNEAREWQSHEFLSPLVIVFFRVFA